MVGVGRGHDLLSERRLGRIATVGPDGTPHVTPGGWRAEFEHGVIEVGGINLPDAARRQTLPQRGSDRDRSRRGANDRSP